MKRKLVLIIGVLCMACATALARTLDEAAQIASQFFSYKEAVSARRIQHVAMATTMARPVDMVYTQYQWDSITPALYVFNNQEAEGFVVVSAVDNTRVVLGYSDKGYFNPNDIPENMQFWLQMYADEIKQMQVNTCNVNRKCLAMADEVTYPEINPILDGVEWNQSAPFNNMCPIVDDQRSVSGCVATALSQIMYAHKYPERGVGSKTYTLYNGQTISAEFDTVYDWANMLPSYNADYTPTQADAVALLVYHVGVASAMKYTPYASGTSSAFAFNGMISHFGYDAGINALPKDYMQEADILTAISKDLQVGMPVYLAGYTKSNAGHAFICDGMQSNGYLHINWGWGGLADGYFSISALDPLYQGIGGSSSAEAFTEGVVAYTGICPDKGGVAQPLMTAERIKRVSAEKIGRNDNLSLSLEMVFNIGIGTAKGDLGYYIYDEGDTIVSASTEWWMDLPPEYGWTTLNLHNTIPADLPAGKYELEIAYRDSAAVLYPMLIKNFGVLRMPMVIEDDSIIFEKMPIHLDLNNTQKITRMSATNLNQTQVWKIDLSSSGFGDVSSIGDDLLMRMTVNSANAMSVVGSYVLDMTNSGDVGTINGDVLCMAGYDEQACKQYVPTDLHLTITEGKKGTMQVEYYVSINGMEKTDIVTINTPKWYIYENEEYKDYSDAITYDLVATLPASKARQMTLLLTDQLEFTKMSYFVRGKISTLRNTPEEIVRYRTARFDISDDGTSNNQYYCYGTKYLNNSSFVTGEEISTGDEVVVYGQMRNSFGNDPQIKGYIYVHNVSSGIVDCMVDSKEGVVYDIMGRKVNGCDELPDGMYILKTGDKTTKIYINK